MPVTYTRVLLPGHANEFDDIIWASNQVRRVLAGIVHEDVESTEFVSEVKLQFQPRSDGGLAIIGWCGREAVEGIPDEQFDPERELIPTNEPEEEVQVTHNNPFLR